MSQILSLRLIHAIHALTSISVKECRQVYVYMFVSVLGMVQHIYCSSGSLEPFFGL